jgi:hypothetical protein
MSGEEIVPFQPPKPTGSTLDLAPEAWKLASRVADTEFVPKALRGKPEAVLACILAGYEAGLSPMTSLRSIHVVDGRPAMSAELMRAVIQRAGHDIWVEETNTTRAIVSGQRSGSARILKVTWTEDDARRAGLTGKDNWKKYPRAMLVARATTELARMLFPDVLAGISHSIEELADGGLDDNPLEYLGPPETGAQEAAQASPPARTAKARRAAVAPQGGADPAQTPPLAEPPRGEAPGLPGEDDESDIVDAEIVEEPRGNPDPAAPTTEAPASYRAERSEMEAPPLDEYPPDDDPPPPDAGPRLTGPQVIAMRLAEHGITDRPGKLRWVASIVGHPVETTNDLGPEETAAVLEFLDALPAGQLLEPIPAPPAPPVEAPAPGPARTAVVTPPEEWTADRWREYLKSRGLKVAPVLKEAQRLGATLDPPVVPALLDDLAGSRICSELIGWCEDQS